MCVVAVSTLMIPSVFAAYKDNNIGFSFRIQGSVDNAQALCFFSLFQRWCHA